MCDTKDGDTAAPKRRQTARSARSSGQHSGGRGTRQGIPTNGVGSGGWLTARKAERRSAPDRKSPAREAGGTERASAGRTPSGDRKVVPAVCPPRRGGTDACRGVGPSGPEHRAHVGSRKAPALHRAHRSPGAWPREVWAAQADRLPGVAPRPGSESRRYHPGPRPPPRPTLAETETCSSQAGAVARRGISWTCRR